MRLVLETGGTASEQLKQIHDLAKRAYNANSFTQGCGYLFKGRSRYTNNFYGVIRNLNVEDLDNIETFKRQLQSRQYLVNVEPNPETQEPALRSGI